MKRIGTLCFATDQGLGILAKSFHDAGIVTNALVVRHSSRPTRDDWYPGAKQTTIRPFDGKLARDFCASMDAMLFFETPFDWSLIPFCREHGVKTVLMVMHECTPAVMPHRPDVILAPSHLDAKVFPGSVHIPVPVETPWKMRERAGVLVHNAGHGGLRGRNGTKELLEALRYVRTPIDLILRSQEPVKVGDVGRVRLDLRVGTFPRESLWDEGDVFVFPERFNGLSLPLQEARAAGMLVMCGDRFPMNEWLPPGPLIPVVGYSRARIGPPYMEFEEARFDPLSIAQMIDAWAYADITEYSISGRDWARTMSWGALKHRYLEVLS